VKNGIISFKFDILNSVATFLNLIIKNLIKRVADSESFKLDDKSVVCLIFTSNEQEDCLPSGNMVHCLRAALLYIIKTRMYLIDEKSLLLDFFIKWKIIHVVTLEFDLINDVGMIKKKCVKNLILIYSIFLMIIKK
jgi:hypothetical protein